MVHDASGVDIPFLRESVNVREIQVDDWALHSDIHIRICLEWIRWTKRKRSYIFQRGRGGVVPLPALPCARAARALPANPQLPSNWITLTPTRGVCGAVGQSHDALTTPEQFCYVNVQLQLRFTSQYLFLDYVDTSVMLLANDRYTFGGW